MTTDTPAVILGQGDFEKRWPDSEVPAFPVVSGVSVVKMLVDPKDESAGYYECSGLSTRAYAAIHLRVPNSGLEWLDEMIREAMRQEFAAKAMEAMVASYRTIVRGKENAQSESEADVSYPMRDLIVDQNDDTGEYEGAQEIADDSYIIANAMISCGKVKPT